MCHLRNIAMRDYQESVTTGQTHTRTDRQTGGRTDRQTDAGQSDPYVPLCFAGDTKMIQSANKCHNLQEKLPFSNKKIFRENTAATPI